MKLLLLSLLPFACIACSSVSDTDPASATANRSGTRKVAAATGGHGAQTAVAASATAAAMTPEQTASLSVFADEDRHSKTLKGTHRQVAASTSGHGTQNATAASAAAIAAGQAHEAEASIAADKR